MIRILFLALLGWLAAALPAAGQPTDLVFAVTEGVTYQATPKEIRDKFEPLAAVIGKALNRNVHLVLVPAYDDARAGLAKQEFDIAFIHPAHVALAEIKAKRYVSIGWTSGFTEYTVSLLTNHDRPFKDMKDLRNQTLVTPDPDSITAVMVRAMLRAQSFGAQDVKVITTRYQDAIPYYLENGFAQVGATAATAVVKQWTDKGGKVVVRSPSVPIKQIIVSSRLSAEQRDKIREALLTLGQTEPGRRALAACGYKGFTLPSPEIETAAITWLGI